MDLGKVQIENGCFIEEDGSTYCFCDFNRCNAAGILDLRNLLDEKKINSIFKLENNTSTEIEDELNELIFDRFSHGRPIDEAKVREGLAKFAHKHVLKPAATTKSSRFLLTPSTKTVPKTSSKQSTTLFPFKTSFDPKKANLNDLLKDYLNFSDAVKGHNATFNSNSPTILKKPKAHPKQKPLASLTTAKIGPSTQTPAQYKLKINDTISKKLIESLQLRSNLGLKPNEKINIVLLKRPSEPNMFSKNEILFSQKIKNFNDLLVDSHKMSKSLIKRPSDQNKLSHQANQQEYFTTSTASNVAWLSKLRAKLIPNLVEQPNVYGITEPNYEWNHVLGQKYKQGFSHT